MKLKSHFHLASRLRTSGAIPLLPVYTFMALTGKAHADAVKRRPLTAETRVQSQSVTIWIFGKQSGTSRGLFLEYFDFSFSLSFYRFCPLQFLSEGREATPGNLQKKNLCFCLCRGTLGNEFLSYCLHFGRSLLPRQPGFESGSVHLGFMVNEMAMGHIFLHVI